MAQHSAVLYDACKRSSKEHNYRGIHMPNDDPLIFGLFVDWMHEGSYDFPASDSKTSNNGGPLINADIKAWMLGDKLRCTAFKNFAMARLHAECSRWAAIKSLALTPTEIRFVCERTGEDSKLRACVLDFVGGFVQDPAKLAGDEAEWTALFQSYAPVRSVAAAHLLGKPGPKRSVKDVEEYIEKE
ncbi:hypothetical protein IQ07DRAFT_62032 [Pyrenochaeta sp. DS3sAY3a]|nr:hypothetical protein IQ07DRAFT_62032 [Pyrenochaeta sp. DS3sAY3a]